MNNKALNCKLTPFNKPLTLIAAEVNKEISAMCQGHG